tara:strand:- start:464 stop:1264 length:801 start_codon:yes stop_codon:yes gene_type:complete
MRKISEFTSDNKAAWNASATYHQATLDIEACVTRLRDTQHGFFDSTFGVTLNTIGVQGKKAVQIGCNNGREALSLAKMGATSVLGIDQSDAFLTQAETLKNASGLECQFLCADIYHLPPQVDGDFDLGVITIGVLNWMPDLERFFQAVAGLLVSGGTLAIYETHPVLEMFDPAAPDPFTPQSSYFDTAPHASEDPITYDGSSGENVPVSWWFSHTMGAIITAAIKAGLRVERLTEYPHSNREVQFDIYEGRHAQVPMCFELVLTKT